MSANERDVDRESSGFGLGKAQARTAAAFLLTVAVLLAAFNAAGWTYLNPRAYLRSTLVLYGYDGVREPYDVLMVGSSRIDYSMDGRIVAAALEEELGEPVRVYKLAQHGLRPWLLHSVLRDFVVENPPQRVLVVGMGLQFFNDQGAKPTALKQIGSIRELADADYGSLTAEQWRALLQLPFRGIHVMWNLDWALSPDVLRMRDHLAANGGELSPALEAELTRQERFRFVRRMITEGRYDVLPGGAHAPGAAGGRPGQGLDERLGVEPFDEVRQGVVYDMENYWFDRVLDLLEELPCEVMLVRTPVKPAFLQSITPETHEEFRLEVVPDIRRRGFGYHDLNREPYPRKHRYFDDVVHMTEEGRRITSETFAREILAPALRRQHLPPVD